MNTLVLLIGLLAKLAPLLASLLSGFSNRKSDSTKGRIKPQNTAAIDGLLRAVRAKWHWQMEEKGYVGKDGCDTHAADDTQCLRDTDGYRRD